MIEVGLFVKQEWIKYSFNFFFEEGIWIVDEFLMFEECFNVIFIVNNLIVISIIVYVEKLGIKVFE